MTTQASASLNGHANLQRGFLGVLAPLLLCLLSFGTLAQTSAGTVMVSTGRVVAIDQQGRERDLLKGGEVFPGDRVVTAEGALTQIRMLDGGYLSIRSSTEMAIEKFVHDEKNQSNSSIVHGLIKGGLRSITGLVGRNNPAAYQVRTSTATIGIRGTDHEPMFIPVGLPGVGGANAAVAPGLYDKVNSGETFIRNDLGTISLKPGQVGFSPIKPEVPPQTLVKIPEFYKVKLEVDRPEGKDAEEGERKPAPVSKGLRPTTASRLATQKPLEGGATADRTGSTTLVGTKTMASEPVMATTSTAKLEPTTTSASRLEPMATTSTSKLEPMSTSPTLIAPTTLDASTTTLQPKTTLSTSPTPTAPTTTTLTAPTTTTIQPKTTAIAPTTTLIAPTTTTLIAPTTTTATTLIAPKTTTTTTLIAPKTTTTTTTPR